MVKEVGSVDVGPDTVYRHYSSQTKVKSEGCKIVATGVVTASPSLGGISMGSENTQMKPEPIAAGRLARAKLTPVKVGWTV